MMLRTSQCLVLPLQEELFSYCRQMEARTYGRGIEEVVNSAQAADQQAALHYSSAAA